MPCSCSDHLLQALDLNDNTKPLLYLFSKPTCGACKRLKAEFTGTAGRQLVRASRDYLMINISGDEENNKFGVSSSAVHTARHTHANAWLPHIWALNECLLKLAIHWHIQCIHCFPAAYTIAPAMQPSG